MNAIESYTYGEFLKDKSPMLEMSVLAARQVKGEVENVYHQVSAQELRNKFKILFTPASLSMDNACLTAYP